MPLITHMACACRIEDFEKATDTTFDMVVRLRPDDFWLSGVRPYCGFDNLRSTTVRSPQPRSF